MKLEERFLLDLVQIICGMSRVLRCSHNAFIETSVILKTFLNNSLCFDSETSAFINVPIEPNLVFRLC